MERKVGGHSMLYRLMMIAGLTGAIALASAPTLALDLPDSGSKNFSPGNDTPTHFANESVPVSARTADTTASDFSAEEAAAPIPSVVRPGASAHHSGARHRKYASAQKSSKHTSGKSRGNNHSARGTTAHSRESAYHSPARAGTAGKRPASVEKSVRVARGGSNSVTPSAAKTATAKHGKAGARHVGVVIADPKDA
jgi:hypothetical protein